MVTRIGAYYIGQCYLSTDAMNAWTYLPEFIVQYMIVHCYDMYVILCTMSCMYTCVCILYYSTLYIIHIGAFGYFEVTHDITEYCKAKVFGQIGKRTPIAVRFSTVGKLATDSEYMYRGSRSM